MITGFVLYLGGSDWLIFQGSVEGREIGKGFYKWMETEAKGNQLANEADLIAQNSSFVGRAKGASTKDCPLPSKYYHPRGYLDSLLCSCLQRDHKLRISASDAIEHPYFDKFREAFGNGKLH